MKICCINGGRFISRGVGRHPSRVISSYEIILVIHGDLIIYEGDKVFELHSGDYLLLYPGKRHGGAVDYPKNLSFFWLHFYCSPQLALKQTGKIARLERIIEYFNLFLQEQKEFDSDQYEKDILLQLILRECSRRDTELQDQSNIVHWAMQELKLGFRGVINRRSISRKINCNPDYLGRIFKEHFHETVIGALNRIRLEHAAGKLRAGTLSIKEIGELSGFRDPAYFRRTFFRKYGMTPKNYRIANAGKVHVNTE